ncbi:unnamed protein product, partial [Nesidiocoris tenuis]
MESRIYPVITPLPPQLLPAVIIKTLCILQLRALKRPLSCEKSRTRSIRRLVPRSGVQNDVSIYINDQPEKSEELKFSIGLVGRLQYFHSPCKYGIGTSFSPAVYGSNRSASDNDNDEGASWERSSEVLLQERRVETDVAGKPGGDGRQIVRTAEDLSQYPGWLGSRHSSSPLPWLRFSWIRIILRPSPGSGTQSRG